MMRNIANVSPDRVLKLKQKEDAPKVNSFAVNPKVFEGDIELHAIQETGLWSLKYINASHAVKTKAGAGQLPEQLRQRWTNFNQMMKFVTIYFSMRHIEVEEIIA